VRAPLPVPGPGFLRVTEDYLCLEGEGLTLGAPTHLIRLSGCDLRCWWCDSKQSSFDEREARLIPIARLLKRVGAACPAWVSMTGGEPLWRSALELASLGQLMKALKERGYKVKIESNGRHWRPELDAFIDLWSVAPKWDGRKQGLAQRSPAMDFDLGTLRQLCQGPGRTGRLQLKFVITTAPQGSPRPADLARVKALLKALGPEVKQVPIYLTPEGLLPGADYLERNRRLGAAIQRQAKAWADWDIHVAPQWHRVLHGDARRR